jgi:hypothetical protein
LEVSFKDHVTVILLLSVYVHVYITDMLGNEYSFKKLSQTFLRTANVERRLLVQAKKW